MSSICGSLRAMMRSVKASPANKMAQMASGYWAVVIEGSRSCFFLSAFSFAFVGLELGTHDLHGFAEYEDDV